MRNSEVKLRLPAWLQVILVLVVPALLLSAGLAGFNHYQREKKERELKEWLRMVHLENRQSLYEVQLSSHLSSVSVGFVPKPITATPLTEQEMAELAELRRRIAKRDADKPDRIDAR